MIHASVDGSFRNAKCGWGVVISDGPYHHTRVLYEGNGVLEDDQGHAQVGGELKAAMVAVAWAINHDYKELVINYDYTGIRLWVTGEWRAKKQMTIDYRQWMRNQIEAHGLLIYWSKVKGHSGVPGNMRADQLAQEMTTR